MANVDDYVVLIGAECWVYKYTRLMLLDKLSLE